MEKMHHVVVPGELHKHFTTAQIKQLHADMQIEVNELPRPYGAGIFIKEDVLFKEGPGCLATMCMWETLKSKRKITYLKYHVYKGDIPDAVLDDINYINTSTKDATWKRT